MEEILRENTENTILNCYQDEKKIFCITPQKNSNIKCVYIIKNSELDFTFNISNKNINIECYFLVPAIDNQNVKLNINNNFISNDTKAIINIIALCNNESSVTLNGSIHIGKDLHNVEARLYEETLLLGNAKYISLIPGLRVDSPDVIASHGARIQRISQERIFYMQSRGLDKDKAIDMIINSYSQQIIERLQLNESEKSKFYSVLK